MAASLTIWSNAGGIKSENWISATGRIPLTESPMAEPTIRLSARGVSITLRLPELFLQPLRHPEDAAGAADVLAQDHHRLVGAHLLGESVVDRLEAGSWSPSS